MNHSQDGGLLKMISRTDPVISKNSFKWKSDGSPKKNTQFYLNNQELKDDEGSGGSYHFRYSNTSCEYVPSVTK